MTTKYDKKLLKSWVSMPDWGDYLDQNGGLNNASQEGFDFLTEEYYSEVKRRIDYCKKLIEKHKDAFINYVLAELYERCNEDESVTFLYKRPVKYYCLRALDIDPNFVLASELLQKANEWVSFIGGDDRSNKFPDINFSLEEEKE